LRHVESRSKMVFAREKEEAFFTEDCKEYVYGQTVVGCKNEVARKMQFDKCLAIQILLIPRIYQSEDHDAFQTKSKRAKKLGLNIDENQTSLYNGLVNEGNTCYMNSML